ncbi:hypothetical protein R3W88_017744 [Solanum pinnatisectum]|uniref:Ubiquitin-like protease family profile domain-containing protein n=1 Tax=Solanum pinnatisectum TaxID=50273 RepID=A0AAV9L1E3_9SOLN|nr:hypothetical protein R3W88_017744 [Solanum pinnatisectum]
MNFGVDLVDNKNWFYKLSSKGQLLNDSYADLDNDVCCVDEEHIIGEYIRGYKVHAGIPWYLVDHIFVPVNVKNKFHWVLAVVSRNDKRIDVYDSYRAAGHDAAIKIEVKKLAQL